MRYLCITFIVFAYFLVMHFPTTGFVYAAETDDEAKNAFAEGTKLYESGKFVEAAEKFRFAYNLRPIWKILYNVGQSESSAKRFGLALDAFERFLVDGGDEVIESQKEEVTTEIARMRLLVGMVEVDAPKGAEMFVDGLPRGQVSTGDVVRVAAGPHLIVIEQNGEALFESRIKIKGGITIKIRATPATTEDDLSIKQFEVADDNVSTGASVAQVNNDTVRKARILKISGFASAGIGLVGMGVGFGFLAKGKKDSRTAADLPADSPEVKNYNDTVLPRNNAVIATGFIVGTIGIATGTVLLIMSRKKLKKMLHDKFYGRLIDVKILTALGKIRQSAEGLVDGRHFKSRKIKNIFMANGKFIGRSPQRRLGIAAGADNIDVLAESCPQVYRRYGD